MKKYLFTTFSCSNKREVIYFFPNLLGQCLCYIRLFKHLKQTVQQCKQKLFLNVQPGTVKLNVQPLAVKNGPAIRHVSFDENEDVLYVHIPESLIIEFNKIKYLLMCLVAHILKLDRYK